MKKRFVHDNSTKLSLPVSNSERSRMQAAMLRVIQGTTAAATGAAGTATDLLFDDHKQHAKAKKTMPVALDIAAKALALKKRSASHDDNDAADAADAAAASAGADGDVSKTAKKAKKAAASDSHVISSLLSKPAHRRLRVLIFSSRGVASRFRHLMNDVRALVPHSRRDAKMEKRDDLHVVNEVAEMQSCNKVLYFEVHKKRDLFLWFANVPHGPSAKFHVVNVHTMAELKLTGNALKGSRPLLHFDAEFDSLPHFALLKELFTHTFSTPNRHAKSKPFFDHIICFFVADGKIWFRHYQIIWPTRDNTLAEHRLVEIGPRMVMIPIRIFDGSFTGTTLYKNAQYETPATLRRIMKSAVRTIGEDAAAAREAAARARKVFAKRPIDPLAGHHVFREALAAEKAALVDEPLHVDDEAPAAPPIDGDDDDDDDNDDNNDDDNDDGDDAADDDADGSDGDDDDE
jgi:ribosome biogenesis protein BRX1